LSSRSRRRAARAAALALCLLCAAPARALDIKLWPLFRYAHDPATDDLRWTALGPLLEFKRTAGLREMWIRPLIHFHQRRGPEPNDGADILYPLAATRWAPTYQSVRVLLFTYRIAPPTEASGPEPPPASLWARRLTLFPFVFYRSSPEEGTRLSVFPFYLNETDVFGYESVRSVMFPAYLRLTEPRVETTWYGFPFVSTVGGTDGRGFRVFPFYGSDEIVGRESTSYVLWPFHIRSARLIPGYGWERRRIDLPVYAEIDGAARTTRAWGVLAHTHTENRQRGTETTSAPWPFVVRERRLGEEEYYVWRAFPFYGRSDANGVSSRFYGWPAYRTRTQDVDGFHYERQDVGLVLWRHQTLRSEGTGKDEELLTVFPAVRAEREEWRSFGQAPALADSLLPRNRGVLGNWAPLYALFRWDTRPGGTLDWNLGWGLLAREDSRLRAPWHLELDRQEAEVVHGG
jgi:hypothetical protein